MTDDELIEDLLDREQGYQEDPRDAGNTGGGATKWGITAKAWGTYRRLGRHATKKEILAITRDQAVAFYRTVHVAESPFRDIRYEPLRVQLIDFGVNSGPARAIRWLQRVLRVPVTGQMDDQTWSALAAYPHFLVHEALIGARSRMVVRSVEDGTIDRAHEHGLLVRAVGFSEIRP